MSSAALGNLGLFLIDDHVMFREGLAQLLAREPGFQIAGQSSSAVAALSLLPSTATDVILLDVDLGPERALDFVLEAKRLGLSCRILILTAGVSGQVAIQLVQAGIAGIVHKHNSTEMLCNTIRQVAAGQVWLEKDYLSVLFRSMDRSVETRRAELSDRDKTIVRLIFQGRTNKEIGAQLSLSESTVKFSLRQLCERLGVRTRSQLVKVALEQYRDQL